MPERLNAAKLHVEFVPPVGRGGPIVPRRYTLTHSDRTGDLFLTIGPEYDGAALAKPQARAMADEVLAEWVETETGPALVLHCRAQGGLPVFGTARMRCDIFRSYMPMVLEALHTGDRALVEENPALDEAPVEVCFHWRGRGRELREPWGVFGDWR